MSQDEAIIEIMNKRIFDLEELVEELEVDVHNLKKDLERPPGLWERCKGALRAGLHAAAIEFIGSAIASTTVDQDGDIDAEEASN